MQFDRKSDPSPLTAARAVSRGQLLINWPVRLFMFAGFGIAYFLFGRSHSLAGVLISVGGFAAAWLWWSYFIPQWRSWAISRGADPEDLQSLGEQASLVWPVGSFFERTEIRRNGL